MKKTKTQFECQHCGNITAKWVGKCVQCQAWNSFVEIKQSDKKLTRDVKIEPPEILEQIQKDNLERTTTSFKEFDRVTGGGLVPGSVIFLGGAPGIGKSTLLLQIMDSIGQTGKTSLYFSAEESKGQIRMRADRLNIKGDHIQLASDNEMKQIRYHIESLKPDCVVIDSIQTIYHEEMDSVPGSIGQLKECTFSLINIAKSMNINVILIGHITKDGQIAGPKVLEHMVDTVLYFEGDQYLNLRVLRSFKNRFGSVNEIGLFMMSPTGLQESTDLHQFFLNEESAIGVAKSCIKEGSRPIIIEVQALVSKSNFGMPQRVVSGFDHKRVSVILAILEKKCGLFLGDQDVFIKISGALKVNDPGLDMAIAVAIWSSFASREIKNDRCYIGELSLTGKFQPVLSLEQKIIEAQKFGFSRIIAPIDKKMDGVDSIKDIRDINDHLFE
jgi:DNA repair protein RadA/Sms